MDRGTPQIIVEGRAPKPAKNETKTSKRIQNMDISTPVKVEALKVLRDIENEKKMVCFKQRVQDDVVFSCVWKAYHNLGSTVDPKFVADIVQLTSKCKKPFKPAKALRAFLHKIDVQPNNFCGFYIDCYMKRLKASGKTFDVDRDSIVSGAMTFMKNVTKPAEDEDNDENESVREWVNSINTTNSCIGMLTFFMRTQLNIQLDIDSWEKSCYLTRVCISKYERDFTEVYN
jgi:hypothetical protein